jgi:tetratricopeptide (TPR) repeat protein/transglutaminase-like putative cysteine protease
MHGQAAAAPGASAAGSSADYSNEPTYFERTERTYTYNDDGTGSRELLGVVHVQSQSGVKDLSVLSFPFASGSEHVEIDYVRVRRPDGTVIPTPATDVQEQPAPVTREAPFYSDLKSEQIPVRSIRPGDTLEYHVRFIRTRAEAPGQFWETENFMMPSNGIVALSETVTLHAPEGKYVQVWSPDHKPEVTTVNGQKTWVWHSSQLVPVVGKDKGTLLQLDHLPDLETNDQPRLPPIAWTTFHSWAEVGAWYRKLESARVEPDDEVTARTNQLIAGKTTPEDKARAVYGFVGPQVRYIGVAFGIGRYQPHESGDVLRNQYGDCKDKHTLLAAMLSVAGIQADAALIGAGVPINPDVPSPGWFNHVITVAHIDGKENWLDATAEVASFRLLMPQIRGKQALVIPATGDARLETTPAKPPYPLEDHFASEGSLDEKGTMRTTITFDLHSDSEILFRQAARSVTPAQWDDLMQKISESLGFQGKVSDAEFSKPDDLGTPLHVSYSYMREKSGDWENLRIVPQLPPIGLGDADEKNPPITPIELGAAHLEIAHTELKLPQGWSAELPLPIHAHAAFATMDKTYKLDHGTLIVDRRFEVLTDHLPATDWKTYHQWYKDASLDGELYVQLDRASGHSTVNNENAGQIIMEADQLIGQKDLEAARKKLDAAKSLNEHQARLWSSYAAIEMANNAPAKAIDDLRKEVEYHPDEGLAYRMLATAQFQRKDNDGAIDTMRKFLDRNPGDESAALFLASMLKTKDKLKDAEDVLRTSLEKNPNSVPVKLELGSDLMRDGGQAEARPMLESIITDARDPIQLNNAAYELANNSLDVPLAEKAALKALDLLDEASSTGETGRAMLFRSELLINTWDTYGWILYQDGKYDEALPWIRAAWRNGLAQEPGMHLGEVLEKAKHEPDALAVYQLAATAKSDGGEKLGDTIKARIAALKAAGVHPVASNDARGMTTSLQQQRTYKVPRAKSLGTKPGAAFWGEVELDVTAQGINSVRFVEDAAKGASGTGGSSSDRDAELDAVKAYDFGLGVPPASKGHLIRRGVLSCHGETECDLVLESPSDLATQAQQ